MTRRTFAVPPRGVVLRAGHDGGEEVLFRRPERLLEAAAGAERTDLDTPDDVRREVVPREVRDEAACAGVVRADHGAEQCLDLVQAAFEGEDVAFWRAALVAGADVGAGCVEWRGEYALVDGDGSKM